MEPSIDENALTAALTLVPGLVSRNKHFDLFRRHGMRRARSRARLLRNVLSHLGGNFGEVIQVSAEPVDVEMVRVIMHIRGLGLRRMAILSGFEWRVLRVLSARAGLPFFEADPSDEPWLEGVVATLAPITMEDRATPTRA